MLVDTPGGPARVHLSGRRRAAGLLLLGHGAGGGVDTADLAAARAAGLARGLRVGLVEQPYRVAGRRIAAPAAALDAAWLAVARALSGPGLLVVGGRSSGARVACRTARDVGADGVLCLAFPVVPPGRPQVSRAAELTAPAAPRLVVQGGRDAFGVPAPGPGVTVHVVAGADHGFAVRRRDRRDPADVLIEIERAVAGWLQTLT